MGKHLPLALLTAAVLLGSAACEEVALQEEEALTLAAWPTEDAAPRAWPAAEVPRLRFGTVPVLGVDETRNVYEPLVDYLSGQLGVPAELVVTADYAELVSLLSREQLDAGLFTALSYVEAKETLPGLRLVLKQVVAGSGSYLGYVYTTEEARADLLGDLAGKSMCYIDLQSTSGYLYPRALLREKGFDPDRFFGRVEFGGNHLTCLERVLAGQVDASAAYAGAFTFGRNNGLPVERVKIVAKTRPIPYNALAVRPGLPRAAELRLRHELVHLSATSLESQRVFSREARLNAWVPSRDEEFDGVREVLAAERNGQE